MLETKEKGFPEKYIKEMRGNLVPKNTRESATPS